MLVREEDVEVEEGLGGALAAHLHKPRVQGPRRPDAQGGRWGRVHLHDQRHPRARRLADKPHAPGLLL